MSDEKEINLYQALLEQLGWRGFTEEDIVRITQLDYQGGKYNDFNAKAYIFTLAEYKEKADRIFSVEEFQNYKPRPSGVLDPLVKVYVRFKDGDSLAFEPLCSDDDISAGSSYIPKPLAIPVVQLTNNLK